jgi:hypothetical protein
MILPTAFLSFKQARNHERRESWRDKVLSWSGSISSGVVCEAELNIRLRSAHYLALTLEGSPCLVESIDSFKSRRYPRKEWPGGSGAAEAFESRQVREEAAVRRTLWVPPGCRPVRSFILSVLFGLVMDCDLSYASAISGCLLHGEGFRFLMPALGANVRDPG